MNLVLIPFIFLLTSLMVFRMILRLLFLFSIRWTSILLVLAKLQEEVTD